MPAATQHEKKALLLSIGSAISVSAMAVSGILLDNAGMVEPSATMRSVATLLFVSVTVPATLFLGGGLPRVAAFAFPLILFLFFRSYAFYIVATMAGLDAAMSSRVTVAAFLLLAGMSIEPYRRRDPVRLGSLFLVVAASAAMASLAALAVAKGRGEGRPEDALAAFVPHVPEVPAPAADRPLPDIFYIVPDRYTDDATMAREFGGDGGSFREELESRGFFVREAARANYPATFQSLASTLNMADLTPLLEVLGPDGVDSAPVMSLVRDNAVQRELRKMGYTYAHLGSWWMGSRENSNADLQVYGVDSLWSHLNEYEAALLRMTPVAFLLADGGRIDRRECERLNAQLDWMENARANAEGPLFVFAHLTIPHPPVTMDREGRCIPHVSYWIGDATWDEYRSAYLGYVSYLNRRLLEIFDANRNVENDRGLIFVVQADEGPYPRRLQEDSSVSWPDLTAEELRTKFGIINAIYWDAKRYGPPHLTKTPVNNWRIIFSRITGRPIPLITDERSVVYRDKDHLFDMTDVTDVLEERSTPPAGAGGE